MKTKLDNIRDKLFAIEARAYKARHLPQEREEELLKNIKIIGSIYNELWTIINTSDQRGKDWGWWE